MVPVYQYLSLVMLCISGFTTAKVLIHPETPQCEIRGAILRCDFEGTEETVFADNLSNAIGSKITAVYVYNAVKVIVQGHYCTDLSFHNVKSVSFIGNIVCDKKLISLQLVDSESDRVPRQLNRLEILRSKVGKVICDMGLQRMSVTHSHVAIFNAPWPVSGAITMKIEHSTVEKFFAINIESRAYLIISNSTIVSLATGGITLGKGSTGTFTNSIINADEYAIVVKHGAKFSIKDTIGIISILGSESGKDEYDTKRPPGVPQIPTMLNPESSDELPEAGKEEFEEAIFKPSRPCRQTVSMWIWFAPTVVASVEAFVLIFMCSQRAPKKRTIVPLKDDSEVGREHRIKTSYLKNDDIQEFYDERHQSPFSVRHR